MASPASQPRSALPPPAWKPELRGHDAAPARDIFGRAEAPVQASPRAGGSPPQLGIRPARGASCPCRAAPTNWSGERLRAARSLAPSQHPPASPYRPARSRRPTLGASSNFLTLKWVRPSIPGLLPSIEGRHRKFCSRRPVSSIYSAPYQARPHPLFGLSFSISPPRRPPPTPSQPKAVNPVSSHLPCSLPAHPRDGEHSSPKHAIVPRQRKQSSPSRAARITPHSPPQNYAPTRNPPKSQPKTPKAPSLSRQGYLLTQTTV